MKQLIYLLLVGLVAFCSPHAAAQSTGTLDHDGCLKLGRFSWNTDAGVEKMSSYTANATNPNHMMALLKNTYTNGSVPGIKKCGYKSNGTTREGDVLYDSIPQWVIKEAATPTTEGYTTFLVQVKDSWDGQDVSVDRQCNTWDKIRTYVGKAFKSVKLLYDRVIITGNNPGVLYMLPDSLELNRFYLLSKGRARRYEDGSNRRRVRAPFWGMFEEFAPVALSSSSSELTDFYSKLLAGDVYSVIHDCASVSSNKHYFCMTGSKGTETRQVSGLMFFLPDKRLTAWSGRTGDDDDYVNYNPDYAPKMAIYAVKLKASAAPSKTSGKYTVTLNWSTTLAEMLGKGVVKETFHLYRVEGDSLNEKLTEIPLTDSTATTFSYDESIETAGRIITYRVSAQPTSSTVSSVIKNLAWSNDDDVEIPGSDPAVKLAIKGNTRSEYNQEMEVNQYRNTLTIDNAIGNKIPAVDVAVGDKFYFSRVGGDHTGTCANVVITAKDDSISYSVEYLKQDGAIDSKYPAKTGKWGVTSDGYINFNGFSICDQFQDKTHKNRQSAQYIYKVMYTTRRSTCYSNDAKIKVYKTTSSMTNSVTEAEAKADKDHSLTFTEVPQIQFSVEKNLKIKQYSVIRDATTIGRAQENNQNALSVFELYNSGMKWARNSNSPVMVNDNTYGFNEYGLYVPVISVIADDDEVNTYGCDIKYGYAAKVTAAENSKLMSTYELQDASGKKLGAHYFETTLNVKASVPTGLDIVAYRMWRDCGDKAVEETDVYASRKEPLTPWFDGFESTAQEKTNFYTLSGAAQASELTITDVFGAKTPTASDPLEVKYIVRLYCQDDSGKYYVAEATVPVTYDPSTPTALNGVTSDNGGSFSVAPSVTRGQITVSGCDGAVLVRSLTGAVVMSLAGNGESVRTISVDGLAPGCYIVTSGSHSQRIIKN